VKLYEVEYAHPAQASRARLRVWEQPEGGFLVTEDRTGTATVVKTVGLFAGREEALARVRSRGEELERQRYRPVLAGG
jgi:hypothetical protein